MKASIPFALALFAAGGAHAQTASAACELHIWPTENYVGQQMGGLGMFGGLVGAAIEQAANKGKTATLKDLMHDYLSPDAQVDALRTADVAGALGLAGYTIVIEPAVPSDAAAKADPAVKAAIRAMDATIRKGERLSGATTPCYAELVGGDILYVKKPMWGTNLFAGWTFRDFGRDGTTKLRSFTGQVKIPLSVFPARTPDQAEAAKADLRNAYARDFAEYVEKKVRGAAGVTAAK